MVAPRQAGQAKNACDVTPEIVETISKILPSLRAKLAHVEEVEVVEAMTQVVAGINTFAKVKINGADEYAFLRVYVDEAGGAAQLSAVELGKSVGDPICYFEAKAPQPSEMD